MDSKEQIKEEPIEEYNVKKRKTKQKKQILFSYIILFIAALILFIMMDMVNPYLWLTCTFLLLFWGCFLSCVAITGRKKISFIYYFFFIFVLSALFWSLSDKNYELGYYNSQLKNEKQLIKLTESILNSNLPVEQQQEYLKILFAQHNAQIEIYQKDLKDNIIFKKDFKIEKGVTNYKLDTDFATDINLKQENKKYTMTYTSYEEKYNRNPFLSAITLNGIKYKTDSWILFKTGSILNSLCFCAPFVVLWCFLLIYLKKEKSTNNSIDPEFRKEIETIMKEHKDEFDKLK